MYGCVGMYRWEVLFPMLSFATMGSRVVFGGRCGRRLGAVIESRVISCLVLSSVVWYRLSPVYRSNAVLNRINMV